MKFQEFAKGLGGKYWDIRVSRFLQTCNWFFDPGKRL